MREHEMLEHIYRSAAGMTTEFGHVLLGPGDDCAVVRSGSDILLLTTDQLIEHRHFRPSTPIDLIARKALARSISDVAAMAGTPLCALATAALPENYPHTLQLCDAIHKWGRRFNCPVVGGDLASHDGPLMVTTTVVGRPHDGRGPVLRSGAQVGDGAYVTGRIGGSLDSVTGMGRHLTFEPRIAEAAGLCEMLGERLHAMIDVSDGLGRDAGRVASASGVRVEIEARAIPLADGVASWRDGVGSGEDHELFFTASGEVPGEVNGTTMVRIGRVVAGAGCVVIDGGTAFDISSSGWDHG
jgi:thiamine-monophosphate kinase